MNSAYFLYIAGIHNGHNNAPPIEAGEYSGRCLLSFINAGE